MAQDANSLRHVGGFFICEFDKWSGPASSAMWFYNVSMKLDHVTVTTPQLDTVLHFFCHIVGLTEGERPPFRFDGHWLYHDGKAVVHLVKSNSDLPPAKLASRIDHIAFRVTSDDEWQQLIARLQADSTEYRASEVPGSGERQLFVAPVPGVMIEFVTAGTALS